MYVLSEEEYNRLKMMAQKVPKEEAEKKLATTASIQESPSQPPSSSPLKTHYTCSICSKTYKQKRDLRRHVKLQHSDVKPPTQANIPKVQINIIEKKKKPKKKKSKSKSLTRIFDNIKTWKSMND
jgi:hypothetical protein